MTYGFPDTDTLRLALTSGIVPTAVALAPAGAAFDANGHVWLSPATALPRAAETGLRRLGVRVARDSPVPGTETLCCWLQALPLVKEADDRPAAAQTPVLFELADADRLADLVGEILRLGNDRQAFRWLDTDGGTAALLRVVGPPYYSLLRALDGGPVHAYVERAPRVWVQVGYTHPLLDQVRPSPGKLLLLRPPRAWIQLDEAPFRDIYDVLEFVLPAAPSPWRPTELERRLAVPLRLARGGTAEPAELWVLRERPVEQLDTLVRDTDDQVLARLAFAVGEQDGRRTVVLRVRPSREALPVLMLEAVGFRPYLKLPNLFVPCGSRLHPPLRRDAVRRLLAPDLALVTWLHPGPDGTFLPESLPEEAFRPLSDWVDYVLDHDRQPLQAWVQSCTFDFEPFVCRGEQPPGPPKPPKAKPAPAREPETRPADALPADETAAEPAERPPRVRKEAPQAAAPGQLQRRLRELEQQFLALQSPLGAPERQPFWQALAEVNAALGNGADATVCWVHALWEEGRDADTARRAWLRAETMDRPEDFLSGGQLDRLLDVDEPAVGDLRVLAAGLAGAFGPVKTDLARRLGRIQRFLEQHEHLLPVRGAWLAWLGVVELSGGDVLAVARARDRLLEHLYQRGLSADTDLPTFLRFAGQAEGGRIQAVRDCLLRLRAAVRKWIRATSLKGVHADAQLTAAYADLILAFGLARIGEASACAGAVAQAKEVLVNRDDVHDFLLEAFDYRIRQAGQGDDRSGPLPPEQIEYLEHMEATPRYIVDQLRAHSRILEPNEKLDPYRHWKSWKNDDLGGELAVLTDVTDRDELAARLDQLWQGKRGKLPSAAARARVLATALELAPRIGEAFALTLLERVPPLLAELTELEDKATLLERGLFLAAHFGQAEHVGRLVGLFHGLLERPGGSRAVQALDAVISQCFRGLRKLGMRDEIGRLLGHMADRILKPGTKAARSLRPEALRTLLHLAAGWFYFGDVSRALPVVDEARAVLFGGGLPAHEQKRLALAYTATLGQAAADLALPRVEELFQGLERIQDAFTTNTHYLLSKLVLVEGVVLALVSDDFTVSGEVRRWLDEDEYLVRRRIHRDVRTLLGRAGFQPRG